MFLISFILVPFFQRSKSARLLFLGLDNAGKTTLLARLKSGMMVQACPTPIPCKCAISKCVYIGGRNLLILKYAELYFFLIFWTTYIYFSFLAKCCGRTRLYAFCGLSLYCNHTLMFACRRKYQTSRYLAVLLVDFRMCRQWRWSIIFATKNITWDRLYLNQYKYIDMKIFFWCFFNSMSWWQLSIIHFRFRRSNYWKSKLHNVWSRRTYTRYRIQK